MISIRDSMQSNANSEQIKMKKKMFNFVRTKYRNQAKEIAIEIFDQYLQRNPEYFLPLKQEIRIEIYQKFGYKLHNLYETPGDLQMDPNMKSALFGDQKSPSLAPKMEEGTFISHDLTDQIDENILMKNLDDYLFFDVYTTTIEWLQDPYEKFR